MNKFKIILIGFCGVFFLSACSLEEPLITSVTRENVFGSAQGMEAYSLNFYRQLPSLNDLAYMEGSSTDYGVCKSSDVFYTNNYSAETPTSWSWSNLRDVNFFIDGIHSKDCNIMQEEKDHYEGLARWFRAWFYYDKLTTYGRVPWFEHCLQSTDFDEMYKNRDSRDVIVTHLIEDLDFAAAHIRDTASIGSTRISQNAAWALKSRVCLFEASWRKYHHEETSRWTANALFQLAANAARQVMDSGRASASLNKETCTNSYPDATYEKWLAQSSMSNPSLGSYRSLFYSKNIMPNEVILGVQASLTDMVTGNANKYWNSTTTGSGACLSRAFIYTYLMKDGSRFTDKSKYSLTEFRDEFTNRDERLAQTVRGPYYQIRGANWRGRRPGMIEGTAITGYHVIKFVEDDTSKDGNDGKNENSLPIIRYAEVLLNYAEAKAELGTLTDGEWSETIGAIRRRAGIEDKAGVTTSKPTSVDNYLKNTFYPDITDPVLLEIRRERAIELVYEGFRANDLNRWKEGQNFVNVPWIGLHVPKLNSPFKVNFYDADDQSGGAPNSFYLSRESPPSAHSNKYVQLLPKGSTGQGLAAKPNPDYSGSEAEDDRPQIITYQLSIPRIWHADDRQYLHPIPASIIRDYAKRGYTLDQNPGW